MFFAQRRSGDGCAANENQVKWLISNLFKKKLGGTASPLPWFFCTSHSFIVFIESSCLVGSGQSELVINAQYFVG